MGRNEEARETLARFGISIHPEGGKANASQPHAATTGTADPGSRRGLTASLTLAALCVGFVTFGIMLWLPESLVREGRSVGSASRLLARSTLLAAPTVLLVTWLYSAWSSKRTLIVTIAVTALGLGLILLRGGQGNLPLGSPVLPITLLIVGSNGVLSVLLPYAAENYPLRVRGRATGWVAGCSKGGGLFAQLLGLSGMVPALSVAAGAVAVPCVLSIVLLMLLGRETHGEDLSKLEA